MQQLQRANLHRSKSDHPGGKPLVEIDFTDTTEMVMEAQASPGAGVSKPACRNEDGTWT